MSDEITRVFATRAGIKLGPLDQVEDGAARGFVIQIGATRFHGFVVRRGESIHGYADRCPHAGLPLAQRLDDYLTPDWTLIACAWHGAIFEVESGRCVGGPCAGGALTPWPVRVEDGVLVTG